jgi:hypothetical protein
MRDLVGDLITVPEDKDTVPQTIEVKKKPLKGVTEVIVE